MHAASRHGTPRLTSLPKDGGVSCFCRSWKVTHPVSDRTQPCLTSVKQMELAGPLGHSPHTSLLLFWSEKMTMKRIEIPWHSDRIAGDSFWHS